MRDAGEPVPGAAERLGHRLSGDAADVWALRIPTGQPFDESLDLALLDGEELRRTGAFVRDVDRIRYAVAHIALRRVLATYLDIPAGALRFHRESCPNCGELHGRPAVTGADIHFSLSHGGAMVLVGVSGTPIGVDVEEWPSLATIGSEARPEADDPDSRDPVTGRAGDGLSAALHPAERDEVAGTPLALRRAAFTRLWARKEAYLKGTGAGLGRGIALDYVGTGGEGKPAPPQGWTLVDVPVDEGYAAAAAVHAVHLRSWQLIDLAFDAVRSAPRGQDA